MTMHCPRFHRAAASPARLRFADWSSRPARSSRRDELTQRRTRRCGRRHLCDRPHQRDGARRLVHPRDCRARADRAHRRRVAEWLHHVARADAKTAMPAGAIIVDPIDGTRGLMYQKRPAWILTGVAPNLGEATSLADIEVAVQTEIPLIKQHLSDQLWAVRGGGVRGIRFNRLTNESQPLTIQPSTRQRIATWLRHDLPLLSRRARCAGRPRRGAMRTACPALRGRSRPCSKINMPAPAASFMVSRSARIDSSPICGPLVQPLVADRANVASGTAAIRTICARNSLPKKPA